MRYSLKQIYSQLPNLPLDIKSVIGSEELSQSLAKIIKKHQLSSEESGSLGDEMNYVLIGLEHIDNFSENLKQYAKLPIEKVNSTTKEVNESIFLPIYSSLQRLVIEKKLTNEKSATNSDVLQQTIRGNKGSVSIKNMLATIK